MSMRTNKKYTNSLYWGPPAWKFIESVMKGFDSSAQDNAKLVRWVNLLPAVLPCERCRDNFSRTLQKYPMRDYANKNLHAEWFARVREEVRKHENPKKLRPSSTTTTAGVSWTNLAIGATIVLCVGVGIGYLSKAYQMRQLRPSATQ